MNDVDEVIMFDGRRYTSQIIIEAWRNLFQQKFNLANPETKIDYVQEGGELRNIMEALAPDYLTALHYINEGFYSQFIRYSEGDVLDWLAHPEERRNGSPANSCVIWRFDIPNLKQIKNIFKTYSVDQSSSDSVFNTDNPVYDNRRLPVPLYSYNKNYDELNNRYIGDSVPIAGDFAIMQEITRYLTADNSYPLYRTTVTDPDSELKSYKYFYAEDIYEEKEVINPETSLPETIANIIHYYNDEYVGEVLEEYGDYFIAVWNKNTLSWNRVEFPHGLLIKEGVILTTDPKDTDSEELEFEIILSSLVENDDNDNLNFDCANTKAASLRDSFLTSCGVQNRFDVLLNYNVPSCNWNMRLPVESVGTGVEYNIREKTLVNFDSSQFDFDIGNLDYLSVYNPNSFINATDPEDDDTFKARVLDKKKKCGFGTVRWYELTTRDIVGVEDVKVINRPKGDWTAYIIIKPDDPEIVKKVSCYFSNRCNNLMGVNVGVMGAEKKVIDKILIPFDVNPDNANNNMSYTELWDDTADKIYKYFNSINIGKSLNVKDINAQIDTLPGVSLAIDEVNGFFYYDNNEDVMKNSKSISVCETCAIYINPDDIYFKMSEFNPEFIQEEE